MDDVTKPCAVCAKELESVGGDWKGLQPYGGGELTLTFSFGSRKYDLNPGCTIFAGIICDECSEKMMGRLERVDKGGDW